MNTKIVFLVLLLFGNFCFAGACSSFPDNASNQADRISNREYPIGTLIEVSVELRKLIASCYRETNNKELESTLKDSYDKFGDVIAIAEEYKRMVLGAVGGAVIDASKDEVASGIGKYLVGVAKEQSYKKEIKERLLTAARPLQDATNLIQRGNY